MNNPTQISSKATIKLTTPQLLKGGLYLTWGASLLLLIVTILGVQDRRYAIKTVGVDSAPSIVAAQRIKDALGGMDAFVVKELLVPTGQNPDAVKGYDERRQKVAERLVIVAKNITYGDAEEKPIQTIQLAIQDYLTKIQQARDFQERGDTAAVVATYRKAAEIMDKTLLPAADALDKANLDVLEHVYTKQQASELWSVVFLWVSGLILIGVLVAIQLFLNYRMHCILNPMLLAATAITIVFLGYTTKAYLSASHNLKVAKEDAFESMHALRQARAFTYSANSDESRYLLDTQFAVTHEQAFFNKIAKIAKLPPGQTLESIASPSVQELKKNVGFISYLTNELNNITFDGEREAILATFSKFDAYLAIDRRLRELQQSGKHQEAIALCINNKPGGSDWAFHQVLEALQKPFDINQEAFDKAVTQGFKDVNDFEIITPVVMIAIGLLTLFGLQPRLKEYSTV